MHSKPKLLFFFFVFLLSTSAALAQTAQERHQVIIKAVESGDRTTAIAQLRAIRTSDPELFAANNYDYLLARLSEDAGDVAESQSSYEAVVTRKSLLAGYALWHLARRARVSGDLVLERERLRQFLALQSSEALRNAAVLRLGESFLESGDYSSVVSSLQPLLSDNTVPFARKAQLLSAQALLKDNKTVEARDLFTRILMKMPDASRPDDFALEAVRSMDALDGTARVLTEADQLLRASVYQFNRHFDEARTHYLKVVDTNAQSPTVANALYQVGRGFYQQQQYEKAIEYFHRVTNEFPESDSARDALAFTAASLNRLKRTDDAIATYKQLISRFPDAPNPERVFLNIIDALHEAGRYPEALNWAIQTRARFNNQIGAALALFAQLRIHLAQGQWTAAAADAEELKKAPDLGSKLPSGSSTAEVSFLQGLALEQLGKLNEAVDVYLSIPDGRNEYYGQLATIRLRTLADADKSKTALQSRAEELRSQARQAAQTGQQESARRLAQSALRVSNAQRDEMLQLVRTAYDSLPAYTLPKLTLTTITQQDPSPKSSQATRPAIAAELLALGIYDEAVPAILAAQGTNSTALSQTPSDADYTLATLALRGGLAHISVRFGERLWRSVPSDYVLDLAPREYVELLYPVPYRQSLLKHATSRGVDPRFVLSIARQESRFQADAKSIAAARGMMQFIPETADQMARELGRKEFQQDELYNPDTAILFGANYLASLFRQFPGQPEAVAAAYNGGADNVARWIARSHSQSPERYVPEIGFAQTKDYVFRVMTNYRAYQKFYDSNLQKQ